MNTEQTPNQAFEDDVQKSQAFAVATHAITQQQILLSEKIGALKATDFIKKLVTVTELKMLAEIKESKEYKDLRLMNPEGKLVTVTTWQDFCGAIGQSREHIDENIRNLSTFGEDFLETSQRMGIGYRDLRKLRNLPEEDRQVIINGEAVQAEDKDSLIELIEDMSVKHAKQKESLEKKVKELEKEAKAKDAVIRQKQDTIDAKNDEIIKMDKKLALKLNAPIHERAKDFAIEIDKLTIDALTLLGKYTALFERIADDGEAMALIRINMGHALLEIKDGVDNLIMHHGLDDVSVADDDFAWADDAAQAIAERDGYQATDDFGLVGQTPRAIKAMNE